MDLASTVLPPLVYRPSLSDGTAAETTHVLMELSQSLQAAYLFLVPEGKELYCYLDSDLTVV